MIRARPGFLAAALIAAFSAHAHAAGESVKSRSGALNVETVLSGLSNPWGLAFLPDRRMLVTERPGRLYIVTPDGKKSASLTGLPRITARGQGGLLDVATDRNFAQNKRVFVCFAENADGGGGLRTSLASGILSDGDNPGVTDTKVIFRQEGPLSTGNHFGCRIVQMPDNTLFLTMGDHYNPRDEAQNLANHIGKIVRLNPDGSVPPDNPFVNRAGAKPEIWSYGHRNSQGAAINPVSGRMWMHEHGPRGGDEVNFPEAGKNYGWPVIGFGIDYSGAKIHEATAKPGMEQPLIQWTPVIAPSGMAFYTGDLVPGWKNQLFIGGLQCQCVVRLSVNGTNVREEERLFTELGERIRDVRSGPDGALWLLTDSGSGRLLRVTPAR